MIYIHSIYVINYPTECKVLKLAPPQQATTIKCYNPVMQYNADRGHSVVQ